jgi:hypothetical protein
LEHNCIEVKLVACIVHGWKTFLFPIFEWIPQNDHQSGGMIATMLHYVIRELCKAEPWLQHGKTMPEDLVMQWDGGSENRNREIFSWVEFMCKFFTNIYINRLPPGHTHNDCDQLFGVIWGHFTGKHNRCDMVTIATWEDFVREIRTALRKDKPTETGANSIEIVQLGTTFNIFDWKCNTYNMLFAHGIAPTADYVGTAVRWDGDFPILIQEDMPYKEAVRTSKMLHLHFFKRDGRVWFRWAPRMDTSAVPFYPNGCNTFDPIGENAAGETMYGIRVTTKEPLLEAPQHNEVCDWRYDRKKTEITNAHVRFPEFITAEHSKKNSSWFDKLPRSKAQIAGEWILPEWDISVISRARNPATEDAARRVVVQPIVGQHNRHVFAQDPVGHEVVGCTPNDINRRANNLARAIQQVESQEQGDSEEVFEFLQKNSFVFIEWNSTMEDDVEPIYPWTPVVLCKITDVDEDEDKYTVMLYHCLAYDLKYSPIKYGSSYLRLDVKRADIVLTSSKTSSNTSRPITLNSDKTLPVHVTSSLRLLPCSHFDKFNTFENATLQHLQSSEPFSHIQTLDEMIGVTFKKNFLVGKDKVLYEGTVESFVNKGTQGEGVKVVYHADGQVELMNIAEFIDTVITQT